eukprot:3705759-Karenia_brevis.AAC.1
MYWTEQGWKRLSESPEEQLKSYIRELHGEETLKSVGEIRQQQGERRGEQEEGKILKCNSRANLTETQIEQLLKRSGTMIEDEIMKQWAQGPA